MLGVQKMLLSIALYLKEININYEWVRIIFVSKTRAFILHAILILIIPNS